MNRKQIIKLILFSIGIKVLYFIFSTSLISSDESVYTQYIQLVKKNDSFWYEKIARNGYREIRVKEEIGFSEAEKYTQSEWAFFPFYSYLNRYTSKIFGLSLDLSSLIWSVLFSTLAIIGVYWFGILFLHDERCAFFCTLVLFSFPFSFYYSMFYTEALFLTLVIFCLIAVYFRQYFLLALLLIPLSLLRPNGIIMVLPLYIFHLEKTGLLNKFHLKWKGLTSKENIVRSTSFVVAPIVFGLFCWYQYVKTGFYFAFSIAQAGWYREFMFPVLSFFRRGDFATQFNSIYTLLVIAYAILIRKKLPLSLNIFVLISLVLPLFSGSVTSMPRFISTIFPLFLVLGAQIFRLTTKWLIYIIIAILHFVSLFWWISGHPISF